MVSLIKAGGVFMVDGEPVIEPDYDRAFAAWQDAQRGRRCKCGALIFWRAHHSRKTPTPINADPDPTGNIVLMEGKAYRVINATDLKEPRPPGQIRYMPHHRTCPNAAEFRRAKGAKTNGG